MNTSKPKSSRRAFLKQGGLSAAWAVGARWVPAWQSQAGRGAETGSSALPTITVDDPTSVLGRSWTPLSQWVTLDQNARTAIQEGRLGLQEERQGAEPSVRLPCQIEAATGPGATVRLWFQLPPGPAGKRAFVLRPTTAPAGASLAARRNSTTGQFEMSEAGKPVLVYNYQTIEPGELLKSIAPGNLQYARARSNYIHPLYGLEGEVLTKDWSKEHPHHRGIYWAWPEVDWRGQRGDLHALQRVFARPTGQCATSGGPVFARIEAENLWKWEDRDPIIRERAILRAFRTTALGRLIDLEYEFTALDDEVAVARRGTNAYGGLNVRCSEVREQNILFHTDPPEAATRMAWADLSGVFSGGERSSGLAILQSATNPDYPGDWVKYPDLNWFQPTFPASGTRHVISKANPLKLRFRLWIHRGPAEAEAQYRDQWQAFAAGNAV